MTTIHLVFKTHLDIGFTDLAAKVRAQYHDRFIPQAIETGEHFFAENPDAPAFIWTTGAWLLHDHLATQPRERVIRLERAIARGLIRWHALPFTVHSELMSPPLFRAGLSFARELDQRFGVTTTAAKMTDVPGHTRGIVPLLAEAGVRFLHLGVNSASPVPDVPPIFRWRAPDGSEVVVMYQSSYGETLVPEGFEDGLSFAHTNDNIGPQSVPQVADAYRHLRAAEGSGIDVRASTLDAFGALLWDRRAAFPVLDLEIGDSWIHGSASDPVKTARFRALQRLYDDFAAETLTPKRLAFGRGLTLVAEHTCGIDVKSYLRDDAAWDRPAFAAARANDYRFAFAEQSWAEQHAYLDAAVAALDAEDRARAAAALAEPEAEPVAGDLMGWDVTFAADSGDIAAIRAPDGCTLTGRDGSLLGYRYESYDAGDVAAHLDTYLTEQPEWAILDHAKPGLERSRTARSAAFVPAATAGRIGFAADVHEQLGAPAEVRYRVRALARERLEITVQLCGKPANRMPEAGFVTFTPAGAAGWQFEKLGLWQAGDRIVRRGGGQLQAVNGVRAGSVELRPLDTPLVGPATDPFMPFSPAPPDLSGGLRFNLHNNKWGTNFPMWWGGDLSARFILCLGRSADPDSHGHEPPRAE